jgi:hypothetical protein
MTLWFFLPNSRTLDKFKPEALVNIRAFSYYPINSFQYDSLKSHNGLSHCLFATNPLVAIW